MKINTKKIEAEMLRIGLSMEDLGRKLAPPRTRPAAWHVVHNGRTLAVIEQVAKALELDPKDLII